MDAKLKVDMLDRLDRPGILPQAWMSEAARELVAENDMLRAEVARLADYIDNCAAMLAHEGVIFDTIASIHRRAADARRLLGPRP